MNDILLKLEKLGLSSYEAKAYLALIRRHPANGYEISKIAKIPTAKIYETLGRLKHKGIVIADEATDPVVYYPVPYEKLLNQLRQEYGATIDDLELKLREIQPIPNIDLSWNLVDYETVINKIISLIEKASEQIILSIWPKEADMLKSPVSEAENRGVKVITGIFGDCPLPGSYTINLGKCGVSSQERLGKRLTVAVIDAREVVISEIDDEAETVGIWTATPEIVLIAKEYIKHDIWGRIIIDTIGDTAFNELCEKNEILSYLIKNR